jgi:hypothetical protein
LRKSWTDKTSLMNNVQVTIDKPIYGTNVAVRDKYLKQAIREHCDITIKTTVDGKVYECTVSPLRWIMEGKKMSKVFLIPDRPMVLYQNDILRYMDKAQVV